MATGLAGLVTQAPQEEESGGTVPSQVSGAGVDKSKSKAKAWCRCFSAGQDAPVPKLASVLPAVAEPQPAAAAKAPPAAPAPAAVVPAAKPVVVVTPPGMHSVLQGQRTDVPWDLPEQVGANVGRKTLVLDLDETLIHSCFQRISDPDIVISVELEGEHHSVYVRKRPGVDEFMMKVAQFYEIVVYTASMAKYANPLLDKLDRQHVVTFRLFREACTRLAKGYTKDLSKLGRDLRNTIIIDNSPVCYVLQPHNAIPIKTWRDDVNDRELLDLIPILQSLSQVVDVPEVLKQIVWAADEDEDDDPSTKEKHGKTPR